MKKAISVLAAGVMALSSLPVLSVSAEEIYALGDVDMDGIVTGHDTAMVSRYVLDDTYTLTEEQLQLADVNGDGEVNQADADILYNDMQVYALGDVDMVTVIYHNGNTGEHIEAEHSRLTVNDAIAIMAYYVRKCASLENNWTQVQYNLGDLNLDGTVDLTDACCALNAYTRSVALLSPFGNPEQYYSGEIEIRVMDPDDPSSVIDDSNGDAVLIGKDLIDMGKK
ncbi:MAG: dockerin type I domain-containing protein [Oscillospiraceae bacterium]|nr:dockerin type I domain-containing protein [Oscillospiraceae bacterium]